MNLMYFLTSLISIELVYLLFNKEKLIKVKELLYKIFLIDKITNEENKHLIGYVFFSYLAKGSMYFYAFFIIRKLLYFIISFEFQSLLAVLFGAVLFPLMYRLIMKIQMKLQLLFDKISNN